jgi:hypothetical protein
MLCDDTKVSSNKKSKKAAKTQYLSQIHLFNKQYMGTCPARGKIVESILWSINLGALVYLCFWAIRQNKLPQDDKPGETDV